MDSGVYSLAERLLRSEMADRDDQFRTEIRHILERMSARGVVNSGMHLHEVRDACLKDISARAQIIFSQILRALTTVGATADGHLAAELKSMFEEFLEKYSEVTRETYRSTLARNAASPSADPVGQAVERAKEKFGAEFEVSVAAMMRGQIPNTGSTVVNVTGTVGAVLTGAGSSAVVNQTITQQDLDGLKSALSEVLRALRDNPGLPVHIQQDVPELVEEAIAEVEKPKPNLTRVRAVGGAVATTIQTVGSLQAAYSALRLALMPLGVTLP